MSWEKVCRVKITDRGSAAKTAVQGLKRKNTNMERYKISEEKQNHRRLSWDSQSS